MPVVINNYYFFSLLQSNTCKQPDHWWTCRWHFESHAGKEAEFFSISQWVQSDRLHAEHLGLYLDWRVVVVTSVRAMRKHPLYFLEESRWSISNAFRVREVFYNYNGQWWLRCVWMVLGEIALNGNGTREVRLRRSRELINLFVKRD